MNTSSTTAPSSGGIFSILRRAEAWLDDKGRAAWIAAMVLGFIFIWPVGLALLAYMIWSKRMFSCRHRHHHHRRGYGRDFAQPTGNYALDAYREETLKRLEDEHSEFLNFLQKLREAKDKSEFDQFMQGRNEPREPQA